MNHPDVIALELVGERFGPGRLRQPRIHDAVEVIAERRRVLVGDDDEAVELANADPKGAA